MFQHLGRAAASNPWTVCVVWIVIGLGLARLAPHWDTRTQDDDIRFIPDRFTSVRAYQLLEKAFPQEVFASKVIFAVEREEGTLTDADFVLVDRLVEDLAKLRDSDPELKLSKIDSYKDGVLGHRLISGDRQCTLVQASLGTPFLALATMTTVEKAEEVAKKCFAQAGENAPKLYTTGAAGIGRDLTRACGDSLEGTTYATIILVIVVLLVVYRAPLLALVPLLTIALSVWVALDMLALMTALPGVHLVNISKIFAIVILYGAGTDYCLFLISRYREELEAGYDTIEALARSVGGVGEALAASAGTVMVGLGLMALAEFAKVRYAGPAIALSLGVALVASLTLTPALLSLLGRKVFWPGLPPAPALALTGERGRRKPSEGSFWETISHGVVAHPVKIWCVSVAVLVPLVYLGMNVKPNYRATGELSPQAESLQGLAAFQRHYTPGEIGPITVLLNGPVDWNSREGRLEIDHLTRGFASLPNVAEVRSMTQPLGSPVPDFWQLANPETLVQRLYNMVQPMIQDLLEQIQAQSRDYYLAKVDEATPWNAQAQTHYVTRLDVVLKSDPFDDVSAETLQLIQTWLEKERPRLSFVESQVQAECYGITSNTQDLADVTESDRMRVNMVVLAAIFGILLWLVRRLWLAVYLLLTVLASYYAALGATVLAGIFWTGAPLPYVDWRVPFFLFTILVAVGEDYNILLVNRAMQEQERYGPIEGMRRALAKTGGAITSCGLIMAGTFGTLMLCGMSTMLQIGFALAFGVLIDTFLVRPFLVPAFAIMCWKAASLDAPKQVVQDKEGQFDQALEDFKRAA
jgi:RND superfamily putative drug exporter